MTIEQNKREEQKKISGGMWTSNALCCIKKKEKEN